ncbi:MULTISPECIES: hypothetical protein [Acinetobacter]|uniref:hypothetical protein n=1 Tax=Acinetobacter TaxID=469 RepID=UPI0021CD8DAD|nr:MULTISPECIES: hypothetical protein [Acinetobacter]MCU4377609.1 hypothetical protein [Acinetobacter haemolyticus]MDH1859180.1 hypothetical protein [Acinetobacter junii]
MKKQKPKELSERLPFPEFRSRSIFSSVMTEEERLLDEAEVNAHNDKVMEEINELAFYKLFLLLKYHDIDPFAENKWFLLAAKLANEHETGFQLQTAPSGRSSKWEFSKLLGLYVLVEYIRESKENCSVSQACIIILNNYLSDIHITKKTLENRYIEAKNNERVIKFFNMSIKIDKAQGNSIARNMILKEAFNIEI